MTPPIGSNYQSTYRAPRVAQDAPPTMRADLLPDEYRSFCRRCGTVEVHQVVSADGRSFGGKCEKCGFTEHAPCAGR